MRPGLRFTKAQHETIARLAWDIAHRNAWPSNERWWRSPRLLGHEDITPLSRHDKNGGWDPGALREKPFFDWKYVYDYLEGLRSGDIAASISPSDAGNIRE
jgi:N-acetyl-anhydromuramyl-L-alanine amidase AmpD